jgi:mono/diheme cytochrome c family protein
MDSSLLVRIHTISVMLFLLTYVIKTILLFTSKPMLEKYSRITKVPEMIISTLFLVTGIWLFVIIGGIKTLHIIKLVMVVVSIPLAVIGFKKMRYGMALIALLLIIGAYGLAEASRNKPFIKANVVLNNEGGDAKFAQGAMVYHQNCAFCHGADGKKLYRNAKDLTISVFGYDDSQQMVRDGSKGKMPGYSAVLSDEDIAAVCQFVQSLKVAPADTTAH